MQTAITAQGNYRFPVPIGQGFVASITGNFNGATATFQFLNDVVAAGTAQVETATVVAAAGITADGIVNLVFKSSQTPEITLPVTVSSAVHTTATLIATAFAAALNADAVISQRWTVTSSVADIIFTRKANFPGLDYPANDEFVNLAIPAGLGITAAAASVNTTAGVASKTITAHPFSTTGLSLTAAGEKQGINCGSHPEINLAVTVANPTGIVVNVTPLVTLTSGRGA